VARIIVAVLGRKNSGKTTIIEEIVRRLRDRYRILVLKHVMDESFEIDRPGKDSWRFKRSGADAVGIISRSRTALIIDTQHEMDPIRLVSVLEGVLGYEFDMVLMEGFSRIVGPSEEIYKIITAKSREDLEYLLEITRGQILAVFSETIKGSSSVLGLKDIDIVIQKIENMLS